MAVLAPRFQTLAPLSGELDAEFPILRVQHIEEIVMTRFYEIAFLLTLAFLFFVVMLTKSPA